MDEQELIRACRSGDESAFEALVRFYEKRVYGLCRRMCRNEEDALEAAQDAFLAVWRGLAGFREESSFTTWLYRLTANACLDVLRREKKHSETLSLDDESLGLSPARSEESPEEELERVELRRALYEAMWALPNDFREILLLRETEQLSYAEIAEVKGLELGTVKSRISRARAALRGLLAKNGTFFELASSKALKRKEAAQQ